MVRVVTAHCKTAVSLVVIVGIVGCSEPATSDGTAQTVNVAVAQIRDPATREVGRQKLEALGDKAISHLERLAQGPDPLERIWAVAGMLCVGTERALVSATSVLSVTDEQREREVVAATIWRMLMENERLAQNAMNIEGVAGPLQDYITSASSSPLTVVRLIEALRYEPGVAILRRFCDSDDDRIRQRAEEALAELSASGSQEPVAFLSVEASLDGDFRTGYPWSVKIDSSGHCELVVVFETTRRFRVPLETMRRIDDLLKNRRFTALSARIGKAVPGGATAKILVTTKDGPKQVLLYPSVEHMTMFERYEARRFLALWTTIRGTFDDANAASMLPETERPVP